MGFVRRVCKTYFYIYSGRTLSTKGIRVKPETFDVSHPCWNEKPCFVHRDGNVLAEGLEQAKKLTNSVEMESGLPGNLKLLSEETLMEKENELIHL